MNFTKRCELCIYILGDAVMYNSGLQYLDQALSGKTLSETQNCLLATPGSAALLLVFVDHLLKPAEYTAVVTFSCSLLLYTENNSEQ